MKKLTRKYFTNSLTDLESEKLLELLQKQKHQEFFKKYAKDYYDLNLTFQETDLNAEYLAFLKQQKSFDRIEGNRWNTWYRVAAAVVLILGLGYYFLVWQRSTEPSLTEMPDNVITITLADGQVKVIEEDGNEKIRDNNGQVVGTQQGKVISYNGAVTADVEESLTYNALAVPNGKTFQLLLSDGSKVHLNAGSVIKYPVQFMKSGDRQVFLNGEAYFEVARDTSRAFIVRTAHINIQALGTKFNVNSYSDDFTANTVLVEGAVGLYKTGTVFDKTVSTILSPNQKAAWDISEAAIQVDKVDVNEYIAWTQGKLLFKIRTFSEILKVLERHYDVTITNNYPHLNNIRFFATFDIESIDQVMMSFQSSEPFSYQRNGNHITINAVPETN